MVRLRNLAALTFCAVALAAPAPSERKTVMFLVPWELYRPSAGEAMQGLHRGFSHALPGQVEIVAEYIPAASHDLSWFEAKYRNRKVDAAITVLDGVLTTIQPTLHRLWPGVPVIHVNSQPMPRPGPLQRASATLTVTMSYLETAKLALRLRPDTRRIVIINGATPANRLIGGFWADEVRQNLPGVEVVEWTGLSAAEMKERARRLPPQSVCLLGYFSADRDGLPLTHDSIAAMLVPVMNAPIFDYLDSSLGSGVVGGWMSDLEVTGEEAATMAVEVLRGTPPAQIANRRSLAPGYRFDERQLARWGILTSQLPAGSQLLFHEPTLWERHGTFLAATYASLVLLILGVGGLLLERRRRQQAQRDLEERLSFETIVAEISAPLLDWSPEEFDGRVRAALENLAKLAGADGAEFHLQGPRPELAGHYAWPGGLGTPQPPPYFRGQIKAGNEVRLSSLADLPQEAAEDRRMLEERGLEALLVVPLPLKDRMRGAICLYGRTRRNWAPEWSGRLKAVGNLVLAAVARRESAAEVAEYHNICRSMIESVEGFVVALDDKGKVLFANEGWTELAHANGATPVPRLAVSDNYWDAWEQAGCLQNGPDVRVQLRQALRNYQEPFNIEFQLNGDDGWIQIHAEPLERPGGGLLVAHRNITGRKRLELQRESSLADLSHRNRVSALGELASSLAHEINQPLTAIVANGQTAQAMLELPHLDLPELKEVVQDMVSDGHRAALVIRQMRGLLQRGESPVMGVVDLGVLVKDTVRLVDSEAARRHAEIRLAVTEGLEAGGDHIRIQQVVLNLLNNALDAVAGCAGPRLITISTARGTSGHVRLDVTDTGVGLTEEARQRIFEPFYSTKDGGLGVGLSISRSLITAMHGRLWAEPQAVGAHFCMELPAAEGSAVSAMAAR